MHEVAAESVKRHDDHGVPRLDDVLAARQVLGDWPRVRTDHVLEELVDVGGRELAALIL